MKKKKTLRKKPLEILQNQNELVIKDVPHITNLAFLVFWIIIFLAVLAAVCSIFEEKKLILLLCMLIFTNIPGFWATYVILFCQKIIVDQKKKEITIHILFKRTWRFRDVSDIYVHREKETKELPERYYIAFDFSNKIKSNFLASSMDEATAIVTLLRKEILGIETKQVVETLPKLPSDHSCS